MLRFITAILKFFTGTVERPSPSDYVPRPAFAYYETSKTLEIKLGELGPRFTKPPKVWIPSVADTNSMDPTVDHEHNVILITGADEENQTILLDYLKEGDIAAYRRGEKLILHRIKKIRFDDKGRYYIFKGDNNSRDDPGRIRKEPIQWVSIGVIY